MFALPTTQRCAHVRFVKELAVKGAQKTRNVLLFGMAHSPWQDANDQRDFPNWVSALMTRDEGNRTSLLLEVPPLPWGAVMDPSFGQLGGGDAKLNYLMKKVSAFTNDESLNCQVAGIDLRYSTADVGGTLQAGDKGYRHSFHDNLDIDDLTWMPTPSWLMEFWGYIVGAVDGDVAYGQKVQKLLAVTGNKRSAKRAQILGDAAQICRELYAGTPIELRREVARVLAAQGLSEAENDYYGDLKTPQEAADFEKEHGYQVPEDYLLQTDFDSKPLGRAVISYTIAQKLVDACILGWMVSLSEAKASIVVVVGEAHVKGVLGCVRQLARLSLVKLKKSESILTDAGDSGSGSYLSRPVAIA
ncbi:MAG: hypothetical protein QM820_60675 [Minicystis sp.]